MVRSLFHWKVLLNILLAIAVFVGLVWLTFRWLEFHTNHGKETPVPNVMNMTIHDAIKVLDDNGLDYDVDSLDFNPKYKISSNIISSFNSFFLTLPLTPFLIHLCLCISLS